MTDLVSLGYGPFFSQQLDYEHDANLEPARVLADLGARLLLGLRDGEHFAHLSAALRGQVAVGDWVLCQRASDDAVVLRRVLSRRSTLSRQAAGAATGEQVLAANVDLVLVVEPLDPGPNWRRLERTLAAARASAAAVAVLLTKADLRTAAEVETAVATARAVAPGTPVVAVSATHDARLVEVRALLAPGATSALVGQSGVGKSTVVNALLERAAEAIGDVARDGRGRHTTSRRRLWPLPWGALLVDGPGIRELRLWRGEGIEAVFADLSKLAADCRFRDCTHRSEPGCAVRGAVEAGTVEAARLESFHKLAREAAALASRHSAAGRLATRRAAKAARRALRDLYRLRGR